MIQFNQRAQEVGVQYNAGQAINFYPQPLTLTERQQQYQRAQMLERVHTVWIGDVLKPSADETGQIPLTLRKRANALLAPLEGGQQACDQFKPMLPADASIEQIYDRANGEVLILGEPGAGKTTLLLELADKLLEQARRDECLPMPVIFLLSSWAETRQSLDRQSLEAWLVARLHIAYQIPLSLATFWIKTDQVLPLLDGLDEVAGTHRAACVAAINEYRQDHGLLPTVVCSRQADYFALTTRLQLHTAVVVEPLTSQQIETYLTSRGESLAALRQALHKDTELRTLAQTPLMLNVLTVTYQDVSVQEGSVTGSLAAKREQIFALYVQRMLHQPRASAAEEPEQTVRWLAWLARHMRQHNQTAFFLEQLHPDWLPENWMRQSYDWLAIWLPGVLMGIFLSLIINPFTFGDYDNFPILLMQPVLLGGLLGSLLCGGRRVRQPRSNGEKSESIPWQQFLQWLAISAFIGFGFGGSDIGGYRESLRAGLLRGLGYGLCSLLLLIFLRNESTTRFSTQTTFPGDQSFWQRLTRSTAIRNGLFVGLLIGLVDMLSVIAVFYKSWPAGLEMGLTDGLGRGLSFGIVGVFLSVLQARVGLAVQPTDRLAWSWRRLKRGLCSKPCIGTALCLGLLIGLHTLLARYFFFFHEPLYWVVTRLLSIGIPCWLLLGLFQAVSSETIEEKHRMIPNQGIHRSAFNGLILGLISAVIIELTYGPLQIVLNILGYVLFNLNNLDFLQNQWNNILFSKAGLITTLRTPSAIAIMLSTALLIALLNGELACLRHYLLRFLFWRSGSLPRKLAPFLDFAAEHALLRKVGGAYIFYHRLLLDYFAGLECDNYR